MILIVISNKSPFSLKLFSVKIKPDIDILDRMVHLDQSGDIRMTIWIPKGTKFAFNCEFLGSFNTNTLVKGINLLSPELYPITCLLRLLIFT